jgi:hypothetical protein
MKTKNKKYYYHFTTNTLRDGRPIPPMGEWLTHEGDLVPCESGLHASEHPRDALTYAPGIRLHKVELSGDILEHGEPVDKVCARKRKIVASINAEDVLRRFARRCALDAVESYWKDAPKIVVRYLKTGDESIRAAARNAAEHAAWAATWAAARAAAWDAARDTAEDAAEDAARDAAWDAARAAAWDAVGATARDAAEDAARAAAWAAARAAAGAKYRQWFLEMVEAEFSK